MMDWRLTIPLSTVNFKSCASHFGGAKSKHFFSQTMQCIVGTFPVSLTPVCNFIPRALNHSQSFSTAQADQTNPEVFNLWPVSEAMSLASMKGNWSGLLIAKDRVRESLRGHQLGTFPWRLHACSKRFRHIYINDYERPNFLPRPLSTDLWLRRAGQLSEAS